MVGIEVGVVVGDRVPEPVDPGPGTRLDNPNQARVSVSCSGTVWPTPWARMP